MVTEYLLDMQPGLWKVIAATASGNTDRFIHDLMGIAQHEDNSGDWHWMAKDGLGTVRGVYDDTLAEAYAADRDPYGDLITATGSNPTPFEYTGEPEDQNGLLHLRARYYDPSLAVFNSLDPLETANRYAYVDGNPVNFVDPRGLQGDCTSLCRDFCRSGGSTIFRTPTEESPDPYPYLYTCEERCLNTCGGGGIEFPDLPDIDLSQLVERLDNLIFYLEAQIPADPCAGDKWTGGLYLEGVNGSAGFVIAGVYGQEVVYDFANMYRASFEFYGGIAGFVFGFGGLAYFGTGRGFVFDDSYRNGLVNTSPIEDQYKGSFQTGELSLGVGPLGLVYGEFYSLPGCVDCIEAQYGGYSIGLSTEDLAGGASVGRTEYSRFGPVKDYATFHGKYAFRESMANDIRSGMNSPVDFLNDIDPRAELVNDDPIIRAFRSRMAEVSKKWADVYNERVDCRAEQDCSGFPNLLPPT